MIVQKRRDAGAALRFLRRLLKNQHIDPGVIVTDGLRSYGAALARLGLSDRHRPGRLRDNSRYNFVGDETLATPALTSMISGYGWDGPYPLAPNVDFPFGSPTGLEAVLASQPEMFVFDAASSGANSVEDDYRIQEIIWSSYAMASLDLTPALRLTLGAR